MSNRLTPIRRIVLASVLPLAGLAVACTPTPTCPTLSQGSWSGAWSSLGASGAGGEVHAQIQTAGSTVTGSVLLTGSAFAGGDFSGTIACDRVVASVGDGIEIDGTVSPDGRHISGSYTSTMAPIDHGAISIDAANPSAS